MSNRVYIVGQIGQKHYGMTLYHFFVSIEKEWEKHGLICPQEDPTTCDCCTKFQCSANKNPEKNG